MNIEVINKQEIIDKLCYTELVYGRINKKLGLTFSKSQIEYLMLDVLRESTDKDYTKTGKNFYITNLNRKIRVTINSYTFRIITVDKIIINQEIIC